jgi:hypothetical protein
MGRLLERKEAAEDMARAMAKARTSLFFDRMLCLFRVSLEIRPGLQVSTPVDSAVSTRAEDDLCISPGAFRSKWLYYCSTNSIGL